MKKFLISFFLIITSLPLLQAEILKPVTWSYSSKQTSDNEFELVITAKIDGGWHIYSQFLADGGPVPTSFKFTPSDGYQLVGKVSESPVPHKEFEKAFNMNVAFFENKAVFKQKVKLNKAAATIQGSLEFMVCDNTQCMPPTQEEFSFNLKGAKVATTPAVSTAAMPENEAIAPATATPADSSAKNKALVKTDTLKTDQKTTISASPANEKHSLWEIFILGLLGGFTAFIMPCIFPMVPLTVSFFTKKDVSKAKAIRSALIYGISIVFIYVILGLLITVIFGADALNLLSTNGIFNFFFFLLLVVFAMSFLGAFEMVLPSSWVNKMNEKSEKDGLGGLFFMAATLALVSFSCTGPIIGTLLVQAATMGQLLGPAIGMFGFALALAIPFVLFAMFPAWMKSMPKSGGWLNSVKVILGFLELAFSLKFLSNVDLAYHWNWFDREIFLSLWIVIGAMMGFYLLGKIKLPHDSDLKQVSVTRLSLALVIFAFTVYMIPGLWGAPLKSISAFLPPMTTQDFNLSEAQLGVNGNTTKTTHKYSDLFEAPYGLDVFYDYDEALAYAAKVNKPLFLDFTGHACVNCRQMEANVWSDKTVLAHLKNDFVVVQLYVDDKTDLDKSEQTISAYSKKEIKTIGNKWSDLQASKFNSNSQPFYVLLSPKGDLLVTPQGANYDPIAFAKYMESGLKANK